MTAKVPALATSGQPKPRRLLIIMALVIGMSSVDRLVLGLTLQSIKAEMQLSDLQLGLLTGIAYAAFYAIAGIPISRIADRGNRVRVIVASTALWSVAALAMSFASNFPLLVAARIAAAVGEVGCLPAALSLLSDGYCRAERPRALSIAFLGVPLSGIVGYFGGGWMSGLFGWRITFAAVAPLGLLLALSVQLLVVEPRRSGSSIAPAISSQSFVSSVRELLRLKSFRHLLFYLSIISFFSNGLVKWQPSFFIRSFHIDAFVLGTYFALAYSIGGLIGTFAGGEIASRFAANDERRQLRILATVCVLLTALQATIYLSQHLILAVVILGLTYVGLTMTTGPVHANIQALAGPKLRALAVTLVFFSANLIGMGLGPLAAGALSDLLHARLGDQSLRYALLCLCPGYLWAAWHLLAAARSIAAEIEARTRAAESLE